MYRITNLSILLMLTLFILPTSAHMYANGSSDNTDSTSSDDSATSDESSDNTDSSASESSSDNTDSSSDGSTDENTDSSTSSPENNPALLSESPLSNDTGNVQEDDLANSILSVHNQERAAVGVSPLVWSNSLAAGAQTWAENLATTGNFAHDPNRPNGVGENIAGFNPSLGVSAPGEGQSLWVDEKNSYDGQPINNDNFMQFGHYTQMVWKSTNEVGCGIASGNGHPFSILVCRYNPPGNMFGETPY